MEFKSNNIDPELLKRAKFGNSSMGSSTSGCTGGISSNNTANATNGQFRRRPLLFASNGPMTAPATPQSDTMEAPDILRAIRQEVSAPPVWDDQTTTCSSSPDLACAESSFDTSAATPTPVDLLQPSIGDCSTDASGCSRFLTDSSSGGSGPSPLSCHNSSNSSAIQPLQSESGVFDSYDNGWNYDEPFDFNSSWKSQSLPNIKLGEQIPNGESSITSTGIGAADSTTLGQASSCSYFDDIFNSLCRPEQTNINVDLNNGPTGTGSVCLQGVDRESSVHHSAQTEDYSLLPDFPSHRLIDSSAPEGITNSGCSYSGPDGSCVMSCEQQIMTTDYRLSRTGAEPPNSCGWVDDFFNQINMSSFPSQFPCFQIQRPGNWMPLTVASGDANRMITCVTFCNTLPRVSSITYDHNENA